MNQPQLATAIVAASIYISVVNVWYESVLQIWFKIESVWPTFIFVWIRFSKVFFLWLIFDCLKLVFTCVIHRVVWHFFLGKWWIGDRWWHLFWFRGRGTTTLFPFNVFFFFSFNSKFKKIKINMQNGVVLGVLTAAPYWVVMEFWIDKNWKLED